MKHKLTWLRTILFSLAVLACGIAVARHLMKTRPRAMRRERKSPATLVEVLLASPRSETVFVPGKGTVVPARQLELTPEVSGRLVWQSPNLVPGGLFKEKDEILKIDRGDYEAALKLKQSQREEANVSLKMEEGQEAIGKHGWEMLGKEIEVTALSPELVLRKPQLNRARAAVEAAQKAVERAQYNLDRTKITAPFNAIIKEESVEKDQLVTPQTKVATLIGTDHFWVQVSLSVDELGWIDLPDENGEGGTSARVIQELASGERIQKSGYVIRLLGDLDPLGRRARLLIEIDDPLGLKANGKGNSAPLLLGAYVRVEIEGRKLKHVFVLPSTTVHDGDRVWVMNGKDQLEVRKVDVVRRRAATVIVQDGIEPGDRIVVSRIPMPIPGMLLRTVENETEGVSQ